MSFGESLQALAEDGTALAGFALAAVLVLVLTPLVGRLAPLIGGLDDNSTARACTRARSRASAAWRSSPASSSPRRS